jgi:hypothetical protein
MDSRALLCLNHSVGEVPKFNAKCRRTFFVQGRTYVGCRLFIVDFCRVAPRPCEQELQSGDTGLSVLTSYTSVWAGHSATSVSRGNATHRGIGEC